MLASGGLVITSKYGGQLDFLNDSNSILIGGKIIRAPKNAQYWIPSTYSAMFEPNVDEAAEKLQHCSKNLENIKAEKQDNLDSFKDYFSWDNVGKMLEDLCR